MLLDSMSVRCTNTHIYIPLARKAGHLVSWQRDGNKKASRRKGPLKTTWRVDMKGWNSNSTMWERPVGSATWSQDPPGELRGTQRELAQQHWLLVSEPIGEGFCGELHQGGVSSTHGTKGWHSQDIPWPVCKAQPQCPGAAHGELRVLLGRLGAQAAFFTSAVPTLA